MLYGRRLVLDRREGGEALFYARLAAALPYFGAQAPEASSWLALAPVWAWPVLSRWA